MTLSLSPAAVCQCFTLVALCTSIADPNWIRVYNATDPSDKQLIYGVAFTLHPAQNLTDTGPLGGVNGWGMWLLYTLAAVCYSAVLTSSSSFLTDFLGVRFTHSRLVASLYISTTLLCLVVLGVCGVCFNVIQQNIQKGRLGAHGLSVLFGESFYIEMLGFVFSFMASIVIIRCPPEPNASTQDLSEEPEDREREPLIRETGPDPED
ncbi:transmembrane protein 127 isoform X2 [Hoplias malabaricus]|uniref:transmembrane protein 127 isoform X2 n=1 Tax=Hoplias malabaricus TaxID=27720 RepID=UPI003462817B